MGRNHMIIYLHALRVFGKVQHLFMLTALILDMEAHTLTYYSQHTKGCTLISSKIRYEAKCPPVGS